MNQLEKLYGNEKQPDEGLLYYYLKTHDRVSSFNFEINQALNFPDLYEPLLVSLAIWRWQKGFWSKKQTLLAIKLVNEHKLRNK